MSAVGALKGEVPLTLADGREFTLILDMEALIEAEGAYGAPLAQLMSDTVSGFVRAGRAMLYGAFRAKHPEVSLRDAGVMFGTDSDAINQALERAVIAAFPDPDPDNSEGKDGANPPGPTFGNSGAAPAATKKGSSGKRHEPTS
jgi:hypothetical protein